MIQEMLLRVCLVALAVVPFVRAAQPVDPIASYGVNASSTLVFTLPLPVIGQHSLDDSFDAPRGAYAAELETPEGVFFAAPNGLLFHADRKATPGGIFIPKVFTLERSAYFFAGIPPKAKKVADLKQDLYVMEGYYWHLEPAPTGASPASDWELAVRRWVAGYSSGEWQIKRLSKPVYRYAAPTGWLVAAKLWPAHADLSARHAYPELQLSLVLDGSCVAWMLETQRVTMQGKYVIALPPDQLQWVKLEPDAVQK